MHKIEINTQYGWATAKFGRYANGHLGIQLYQEGSPLSKISTNIPDTKLESREFHFKSFPYPSGRWTSVDRSIRLNLTKIRHFTAKRP